MNNKSLDKNSLEYFVNETHKDLDNFKKAYEEKAKKNTEHYPLVLNKDNVGLWLEFFIDYVTNRTV